MNTLSRLERCLLPPPEIIRWEKGNLTIKTCTTWQKITHCVKNFFTFWVLLSVSPFTLAYDWLTYKSGVQVRKVPDIRPQEHWPPKQCGFATSLFQTSGLGTGWSASPLLKGKCDWDKWMGKPGHIAHKKGFDYKDFFTDILRDPTRYIEMLQSQNVTAHRFSLEWAVIEPKRGEIDAHAVVLYHNFIRRLRDARITPSITLSHFTVPQWFYEQGNFQKTENIDLYIDFALKAMELFPEVKDWWSFNELGVKAFQQAREVYPTDLPEGSSLSKRVHAAGISTRNMLIAHCKLHQTVAKLHPDKKLGVTHQWLKFDVAKGNWMERICRYFFEKFAFRPVYDFFKEGRYRFEFPFMANIQFEMPKEEFEENSHFLMRLGVQAYPKPMVKMGLNFGGKPPCTPQSVQNSIFTLGSACEPGGTVMRFGPRWKADGMREILDEAFSLTDQVFITEFGSDANVFQWGRPGFEFNDQAQKEYLQQLVEQIQTYIQTNGKTIQGIFCWSDLRQQLEWENGLEVRLGVIKPIVNQLRQITNWETTPASQYLAQVYKQVYKEEQQAQALA